MMKNYITGFPRIGEQRELKRALEGFWAGKIDEANLQAVAKELRIKHIKYQDERDIDLISVNDFSFYDLMLDNIITFGAIPSRFQNLNGLEQYFALARGSKDAVAMEMTKWFNTNYHYIVPEITKDTNFILNLDKILSEYKEAKSITSRKLKINLIGPITFLALSKTTDKTCPFSKFDELVSKYYELLKEISKLDGEVIVQIDEPIFVTDLDEKLLKFIKPTYNKFSEISNLKIIFMTYFENAIKAVNEFVDTKIWAIGLDFTNDKNFKALEVLAKSDKVLFAGIINGRNVWRANLDDKLKIIKKIKENLSEDRIFIGTSCSLLHVPFTLKYEDKLNSEIKSWLSFAVEKLDEVRILSKLASNLELNQNDQKIYNESLEAAKNRKISKLINDDEVNLRVKNLTKFRRDGDFKDRISLQDKRLNLKSLPTTTIGSFPQTAELRQIRRAYKNEVVDENFYENEIKKYIDECIKFQEEIDLDVLVHGEPERNDMVEYFGEQLSGYAFTQNGWVQSYGSRCVKPPLLFGDVKRPNPMTVKWITYAQSKTNKPVKGMLTGPVTIMNWSFVRDDKDKSEIVKELALAIADEINDLQNAGIKIIQVDEAAFKEGYPLRKEDVCAYEKFAVDAFRLAVSPARKDTQIHTHMCYSEFNDIIKTIEAMDADVISIETARSGNELLKVFKEVGYKQEIGPGVYDIHSPRVPSVEELVEQIENILKVLPKEKLWINPDCGLKTRKWEEVKPSLKNMVEAVKIIRSY
ncbi:5-methyltetrahydropteroyltriglutamate--homocysteine S-methyltransferase [Campylobacter ureolyticus]|uniref:5-methyltetrahydropteroyltriglutamate--homocysteine methyltransferase n=1 Tax=Campylobacter ureolyticus TaxID=827 RepID=A0A9Q4KK80_9BACT|nr:5-methyltetrahydropteroyltriglutamate--homocysteine S-methyltransferase [Campylobacter ureolyticus]MCZ6159480.1 5-methyltetrahydropteroyltriglutamate--homocysteine S-methyltransferase [Campylobacter ureolyticus]MCZ6163615.1 5-methyltetrahydropteroyltriglutamate--homocysteine S-methyltransferase [Campylobacter ureolyticus]MCZ6165303.1 5-methyltetrahydropteroyltriglutamate--homocysteine S-methyltransferase [Campylobacter ureolyticus]MCZ6166776.1 5-methyltetrahydropteroyltriglutamate--homocyste